MKKYLPWILAVILFCSIGYYQQKEFADTEEFEIHFIDVGQADAQVIVSNGHYMLIDGGNAEDSDLIAAYLKRLSVDYIDILVCSHAHEDHAGGLSGALSVARVGEIYAPKTTSDAGFYKKFLKKVNEQNIEIKNPKPGDEIALGESKIEFLGPISEEECELNNTSLVLKVTYKENSFMFTGDAEREEETDILDAGYDVSADLLKVGHHGGATSTSYRFLREVSPQYAIISVAKDNSYGHPHDETMSRLKDAEVKVFRTDVQGDIIVKSDGKNIRVFPSKNKNVDNLSEIKSSQEHAEYAYIGNKNSKKFHRLSCKGLPSIEKQVFFKSYEEAVKQGYSSCGTCKP